MDSKNKQNNKLYLFPGGKKSEPSSDITFPRFVSTYCRCKKCGNTLSFLTKGKVTAEVLVAATEPFQYSVCRYMIDDSQLQQRIFACSECGCNDIEQYDLPFIDDASLGATYMANSSMVHKFLNNIDTLPPHIRDVTLTEMGDFIINDKRTASHIAIMRLQKEW